MPNARPKKSKFKKANSQKHGAFAKETILWGENAEDYEALRRDLLAERAPNGKTEEFKVDTLAELIWRRERVKRYWQLKIAKQQKAIESSNTWSVQLEQMRSEIPAFQNAKSVEEVESVLADYHPSFFAWIERKCPREKCDDLAKWGPLIASELKKMTPAEKIEGADQFVEIVTPFSVEEEWGTLERMDLAIDRIIKSLVQIKSIKQILPNNLAPLNSPQRLMGTDLPKAVESVVNDNVQKVSAQA